MKIKHRDIVYIVLRYDILHSIFYYFILFQDCYLTFEMLWIQIKFNTNKPILRAINYIDDKW